MTGNDPENGKNPYYNSREELKPFHLQIVLEKTD
jgi:hypothetical protein